MMHQSKILLSLVVLLMASISSMAYIQSDDEDKNEKEIAFSDLPDNVKNAFQSSKYAEWQIEEVEQEASLKGTKYEIEVKNGSGAHLGIYYNAKGRQIEKEDETKEEDDEGKDDDDTEEDHD